MSDNILVPKGSLVKIGAHHSISNTAVGVVFRTIEDVHFGRHGQKGEYARGHVVQDPNGWTMKTIKHALRLGVDEVVDSSDIKNSDAKRLLTNMEE